MKEEAKYYKFFQNRQCEYFPCHKGIAEEDFNCLFCFCPLYALGKACGGSCVYTEQGFKDCSKCNIPHQRRSYEKIVERYKDIMKIVQQMDEQP